VTHRLSLVPGVATCGARRSDGAVFTPQFRRVDCPECLAKIANQRSAARRRFEAAGGGR
jgi:hypothetical protein